MKSTWRSISIIALVALLGVGAALVALRATAQNQATPPPSAAEESATIKDDPTVAADPKQSADNNISFPTDI